MKMEMTAATYRFSISAGDSSGSGVASHTCTSASADLDPNGIVLCAPEV